MKINNNTVMCMYITPFDSYTNKFICYTRHARSVGFNKNGNNFFLPNAKNMLMFLSFNTVFPIIILFFHFHCWSFVCGEQKQKKRKKKLN